MSPRSTVYDFGILVVEGGVIEVGRQFVPDCPVELERQRRLYRLLHGRAELFRRHLDAAGAEDEELLRQHPVLIKTVQRRKELPAREVARGAENDQGRRLGNLDLAVLHPVVPRTTLRLRPRTTTCSPYKRIIHGLLPFLRLYQGVPVRGEPLHALVRQVMADIVVLPFFREIDLLVGDRFQAFRVVGEFRTGNRHPLLSPRLQDIVGRGDDVGAEPERVQEMIE